MKKTIRVLLALATLALVIVPGESNLMASENSGFWECYAYDSSGSSWSGTDTISRIAAAQEAMQSCNASTSTGGCYLAGCRKW